MIELPMSAYIKARVTLVPTEAGGRRSGIASGYRCNCRVPGQPKDTYFDATFEICGAEVVKPGETGESRVQPHHPDEWAAVVVGTVIEMCEGPRLIGHAIVTALFGDSEWMVE